MSNKLASALAAYTPQFPVAEGVAEGVRSLVTDRLDKLAVEVGEYIATASDGAAVEGGKEEEVIIVTSPPP